jgi:hypothetical protein
LATIAYAVHVVVEGPGGQMYEFRVGEEVAGGRVIANIAITRDGSLELTDLNYDYILQFSSSCKFVADYVL